jgi:threonine synthase
VILVVGLLLRAMSFRRAIWVEDQSVLSCTKCRAEFNYVNTKHHCRKCGLVFCHDCTKNKCIIPQDELVPRPASWMNMSSVLSNEDNFRCPQRACDACYQQLRDIQEELRQNVSRYMACVMCDVENTITVL